jgi:hypothetical protein
VFDRIKRGVNRALDTTPRQAGASTGKAVAKAADTAAHASLASTATAALDGVKGLAGKGKRRLQIRLVENVDDDETVAEATS